MPGHKPAARREKPASEEKKPRRKRQHGFARPRIEPTGGWSTPRSLAPNAIPLSLGDGPRGPGKS